MAALVFLVWLLNTRGAAQTSTPNEQIVEQLKQQNRQLARIAASLEIIAGQHSGWKLPKP